MGRNMVEQFLKENIQDFEIGTLKDISEKFHRVHSEFLKLVGPLCALNDSHRELQEAARGETDYGILEEALNELNMSISSFAHHRAGIGDRPQLYVNHIESWIRDMIGSMSMLNEYAADIQTSEEDAALFEVAKRTYQEGMVASKNLHELLNSYNESVGREIFDLRDWPTDYFPKS
jgi:hypothetical protein